MRGFVPTATACGVWTWESGWPKAGQSSFAKLRSCIHCSSGVLRVSCVAYWLYVDLLMPGLSGDYVRSDQLYGDRPVFIKEPQLRVAWST